MEWVKYYPRQYPSLKPIKFPANQNEAMRNWIFRIIFHIEKVKKQAWSVS